MGNKLTTQQFIQKSKAKHGDRYDYSQIKYLTAKTPVTIGCSFHGYFQQTPDKHLRGGYGCPRCGWEAMGRKRELNPETVATKCNKVHHAKYQYLESFHDSDGVAFLVISCPTHGSFTQNTNNHLHGNGCPGCAQEEQLLPQEVFLSRCNESHNHRYDYSNTVYTRLVDKVFIVCPEHGEFRQRAKSHMEGKGCPLCVTYKGEKCIAKWLSERGYTFESQKIFEGCVNPKTKSQLRYDFYLPDINLLLECDGTQHRNPKAFCKTSEKAAVRFRKQQCRDLIKERYAKKEGIRLFRIPYSKLSRLPSQLERAFNP